LAGDTAGTGKTVDVNLTRGNAWCRWLFLLRALAFLLTVTTERRP